MSVIITLLAIICAYILGKRSRLYRTNAGERKVAELIQAQLDPQKEILLNNITLPCNDGSTTQIDHLLISQYGIYVIETKDYSGWIFGDPLSARWTQVLYRRKTRFQNPIRQNYAHIKAISALFDFLPAQDIHSLVVFSGDAKFKTPMPAGVIYADEISKYLSSRQEMTISLNRVQFCLGRLSFYRMPPNEATDKLHIQNLRKKHNRLA
ncbi:nuclease-related domain-containing protein [Motilimonas eburnea]|uniref:nuclease-related domain-containing protein n=1 Tax=Motilimonas eburnea TaxID=1737488 RepID=UPI001E610B72|nr:nuclease-related domain-containing protein [Motilimonas eburnea]MCE2571949.1 NERD domain-containing protein [Motilimonas eburnea]